MINLHLHKRYDLYPHHALLTQEIVLTKVIKLGYDDYLHEAYFENTLIAGIYSFVTEADRNRFVRRCNRTTELEVCFAAQFANQSATEVVDVKVSKPRSKKAPPDKKSATGVVAGKRKSTRKKE